MEYIFCKKKKKKKNGNIPNAYQNQFSILIRGVVQFCNFGMTF